MGVEEGLAHEMVNKTITLMNQKTCVVNVKIDYFGFLIPSRWNSILGLHNFSQTLEVKAERDIRNLKH